MARYFLDTSALVKHYDPENGTARVDQILSEPGAELVVSRLTLVETISVFAMKVRMGANVAADFGRLESLFSADVASGKYRVIRLFNVHFEIAHILIKNHGLFRQVRSLDALQLAVALDIHRSSFLDHFVCADHRLATVATLEGLSVIDPK